MSEDIILLNTARFMTDDIFIILKSIHSIALHKTSYFLFEKSTLDETFTRPNSSILIAFAVFCFESSLFYFEI